MSGTSRQELSLRVISVSTRLALARASDAAQRALIRARADDLLTELERAVRLDGADGGLLAGIERERLVLHEDNAAREA